MLALWALHEHYNIFFLVALLTFYAGIGVLRCIYALFGSLMSHGLIDSSSSLFFCCPTIIFHHTSLFISFVLSFVFVIAFIYLSHFNAWRMFISLSTSISWTLVQRSLVEKVILLERVLLHHCLRVYPFHYVFSMVLVCWYLEYV